MGKEKRSCHHIGSSKGAVSRKRMELRWAAMAVGSWKLIAGLPVRWR
jgi:hypothetical protein